MASTEARPFCKWMVRILLECFLVITLFLSENVLHPFKMLKSKNLIQTTERFIELNPRSVVYVNMHLCGKATTKRFYNAVNAHAQRVRISNAPTPCKSERPSPNHIKSTQIFMVVLQTKHHLQIALCPTQFKCRHRSLPETIMIVFSKMIIC